MVRRHDSEEPNADTWLGCLSTRIRVFIAGFCLTPQKSRAGRPAEEEVRNALGELQVVPGDHLPGIPDHRLKLGADYDILPGWAVGATLNLVSSFYASATNRINSRRFPATPP